MEPTRGSAAEKRRGAARDGLAWALLVFAAGQAALGLAADRWRPALRHPEYGSKLDLLKTQISAHRDKPLLLALGTSRTAFGFRAQMPAGNAGPTWQFNFGLTGIGPVQELIGLHRLLAEGVRPAMLLIEIHPAFLHQTPDWCEARAVDVRKLDWRDLRVMRRYAFEPRALMMRWLMSRLSPWLCYRAELLRRFAPGWLDEASRRDERMLAETDDRGWSRFPLRPADEAERLRLGKWCADLYTVALTQFEVSDAPRRAIDEMLAICRREQIDAALVLMPEGRIFRERYPRAALARLDGYLTELRRRSPARVFDCRLWCDDAQFCDGQHLLPEGAAAFTTRLADDLLGPWLAETSRPSAKVAQRAPAPDRR